MEKKKVVVIGVGGRTGTMFTFELQRVADLLGVGKEIDKIQRGELLVTIKGKSLIPLGGRVIIDSRWPPKDFLPDIIFLTIKNPVGAVVKYYYGRLKGEEIFPTLVLSQNGIDAVSETLVALEEVFGKDCKKIKVVRLNLFNPVDRNEIDNKVFISYSLPIRVSFVKVSGLGGLGEIRNLFQKAGFEAKEFPQEKVKNMEFSKLFLNLIGIASASRGLSIEEGFKDYEVFQEEVGALKEYIQVTKKKGIDFVNFPHYPVKTFTLLVENLPVRLLSFFRGYLSKMITEERKGKAKELTEIEYYNGAVVRLGKEMVVSTPVNDRILNRALKETTGF